MLVDIHCALKAYTKAEMLCRKCLDQREKQAGDVSVPVLHSLLQVGFMWAVNRCCRMGAEVWDGSGGMEGLRERQASQGQYAYSCISAAGFMQCHCAGKSIAEG